MSRFASSRLRMSGAALFAILGTTAPANAASSCANLAGLKVSANEIGLPTSGATVASAQMASTPANPASPGATRDYCKVLGEIAPIDPSAPAIHFEVNLPANWNGKAVQYGGGGTNGTLVTGVGPLRDARRDTPVPIARGFATWGTDAGHDNKQLKEPDEFALNDEALTNMAYGAYKKTHDVAVRIATAFYDRPPAKIYYYGGSEGGREALTMAQRFPNDFDAIVSVVPVLNYAGINLVRDKIAQLQQKGGWIDPAKAKMMRSAVNAACDAADGLADGVISQYEKCLSLFDVKTLRCPNGADAGDHCLSDAQIEADLVLHRPFPYPFPLKNGITAFPGWNYGSEDQPGGLVDSVTGRAPAEFPIRSPKTQSISWTGTQGFVRFLIARDPKFNPLTFVPEQFAERLKQISELFDATDPDLSAFQAHGGKLILKGNGADYRRSVLQEITYYKSVVARLGQRQADQFIRFYVTPGVDHPGNGVMSNGEPVPAKVDLLGALDSWVDTGEAPRRLVQVTQDPKPPFVVTAARPLCQYPTYPRYDGHGDPNAAASFTCAKP